MNFEIEIIKRSSSEIDEGIMGFHDYVTRYESIKEFLNRVKKRLSEIAKIPKSKPQIQYMEQNGEITKAIITYRCTNS